MVSGIYDRFAKEYGHDLLYLGYSGTLRFWGENPGLPLWVRRLGGKCRYFGDRFGSGLPGDNGWLSPWLLYIGRKR